jgi:2-oxoisovalerate dehydrogenase E1 component
MAADLAEQLAADGISIELVDLRTIVPLDLETILTSVRKTGKLLIAHEASEFGGFGGEIAALVVQYAFTSLDAPIARLGAKHCPVPYSKVLEDAALPQKKDLEEAIRKLASF